MDDTRKHEINCNLGGWIFSGLQYVKFFMRWNCRVCEILELNHDVKVNPNRPNSGWYTSEQFFSVLFPVIFWLLQHGPGLQSPTKRESARDFGTNERAKLERLEKDAEATKRSGQIILRKAKLQLNRAALNKSKAALARSLKVGKWFGLVQ